MKGCDLEASQMSGVNLRVATMKGANLQNCNLRGAILAGADLEVHSPLMFCARPLNTRFDIFTESELQKSQIFFRVEDFVFIKTS